LGFSETFFGFPEAFLDFGPIQEFLDPQTLKKNQSTKFGSLDKKALSNIIVEIKLSRKVSKN
jgi:hypothetical protein